jgi:hypothetical protein
MKTTKTFLFLTVLLIAGSISAPVHAGGIVDSVFSGGAKNLAKQTQDVAKQMAELQKKALEIEEKAAGLSDRDRRTFQEELARLGVEDAPEWLFNDASALSSGAPEETQDAGGGLGGLAGLIRGLGGNRGGSSGGSSSSGNSGGSAASSGNTTAFPGGGKTAAFFNIFDGKNYHMKAKSEIGGMEIIVEVFMKGDMMASVSETSGMTSRTVRRDGMMYVIYDEMKTVMTMPDTVGNAPEEPVKTAGMIMTGSGTARFNGKNLPYEEYSIAGESSVKLQLFLDGNNLAGFRTIASTMTIDMVILAFDQNVPNSVFEIPAGYQRMELPQMPDGN